MQTTLLGLAIAFILALVTALVGPFVVDWNNYRAAFEKEATRLVGADVRIAGKIDGRLLPSPRLSMNDVTIGGSGPQALRMQSLGVEVGLGPLLRGEWRASELRLSAPRLDLGLDGEGRALAPMFAFNFDPDALLIERLTIEDGKLSLGDAGSGASVTLERLWFNGEVRSLLGPVKGEGAFTLGGALVPFRIATSRVTDGVFKLRLNVDPSDYPLSAEADGTVTISGNEPRYEGTLALSRPVAVMLGGAGNDIVQPWRIGGKLKATPKAALMELAEFQYGSGDQAARLTGTADFRFGKTPRFDGVVSGRQIDLDRVATGGDAVRAAPVASLQRLVQAAGALFKPAIPVQLGVGIDSIAIGGAMVQNLRGDISSAGDGWLLDRLEFRAPGLSQVRLSGRLSVVSDGVSYRGSVDINSGDPRALVGWLKGVPLPGAGTPRPLRVRGDIMLGNDGFAVERLSAEFDREVLTGRLAYEFARAARPSRLETVLAAPALDIDAVQNFIDTVTQGSAVERPQEVALSLDIGRAIVSGYEARQASVRLQVDSGGLRLDRLAVDDFGGAGIFASGHLRFGATPSGQMTLDLHARDLSAVAAATARYMPSVAAPLRRAAAALVPARLRSTLSVDGGDPALRAKLAVNGDAGPFRLDLAGQAGSHILTGPFDALAPGDVRFDATVASADGRALVSLLGLDTIFTTGKAPAALVVSAAGASLNELKVGGRLTGDHLDIAADGAIMSLMSSEPRAAMALNIARADLSAMRGGVAAMVSPLPVSLTSRLALDDGAFRFDAIEARIADSTVRGQMAIGGGPERRITGSLDIDALNGASLIAAGAGAPPSIAADNYSWSWATAPFGQRMFADYNGRVGLKVGRAELAPGWTARAVAAQLRFGGGVVAFEDMSGDLAGGKFDGHLTMRSGSGGLAVQSQLSIAGADAAALMPDAVRAPIAGKIGLTLDAKAAGLSPATLIGSLSGSGVLALDNVQLASLDPRVFNTVLQASEQNTQGDLKKLAERAGQALETGPLSVRRASANYSVSAGQFRVSNLALAGEEADASLSGRFDATNGTIDARLTLSGRVESGPRPSLFVALRGPVAAPARAIDVSALAGWLTLKSIERQSKQLQAIEARRPAVATPPAPPSSVPLPAPALPSPIDITPAPKVPSHASSMTPQRPKPAEIPLIR